jgi:hypothetical protein
MAQSEKNDKHSTVKPQEKTMESIGSASQEEDGTIVLLLRADTSGGAVGDAQFRYTPSDPDYAMIKAHVGPIPKNGSVPVRPFPEKK